MRMRLLITALLILSISNLVLTQDDFEVARQALNEKNYSRALEYSQKVVKEHPKWFWGHFLVGMSHQGLRNYQEAIDAFQMALTYAENEDEKLQSLCQIAKGHYEMNNYSEALEYIEEAKTFRNSKFYSRAEQDLKKMKDYSLLQLNLYKKESTDSEQTDSFRGTTWGMSPQEVKNTQEVELIVNEDNLLAYSDTVAGLDSSVYFEFVESKLVKAGYIFNESHTNDNDYISDFKIVTSAITDKYGPPLSESQNWSNDLYKDDPQQWGFAVSLGHLSYHSVWKLNDTVITASLRGDNYKVKHGVLYESISLKHLVDERKKKATKEKF